MKKLKLKRGILSIVKINIRLLIITLILSIIVSFTNIYLISLEKNFTDAILVKNKDLFIKIFTRILSIIVAKIFLEYSKAYLLGKFSENILRDIRNEIGKKLINVKISYIEKNTTGDYISRLSNDLSLIQGFLSSSLNDLLYHPITFILGIILAISINWKLTLFCFAIIPISIILALIISKPVEKYTKRQQEALSDVNSVAQDAISGITIVKAFNLEKELFNKYRKELVKSFKSGLISARFENLSEPIKIMIQIIPFVLMFFYGGNLVLKGELTLGGIIAFIELMNIFLAPMNVLPNIINSYRKAKSSSERIEELLNQEDEKGGYEKKEKESDYDIEFEDVYFSYEEEEIIKGISFKVKRGEKVAIVGESGSGKSTIVKLILGLYKPQKGNIKIFGVDIKDWDLSTLREKISVANQDIYLFPESIKENIRYGNYNAKDEDIISATKKSLAYDFIMDNIGFEREIRERGSSISGGERQRIAIARALLKKSARLFILDEATSALDTETEHTLQNILKEELKDKTVLIIAHRFSSIKIAERVIVLDNGKIIEEGTHEELFNKKGAYYQLYSKQLIQNHNSLVGGR